MPKEFITERDVEDMVKRGILSLEINDNIVLTDLAYEKANRLGMRLVRDKPDTPPAAPVRPYLAQTQQPPRPAAHPTRTQTMPAYAPPLGISPQHAVPVAPRPVPPPQADGADLHQRIHNAVVARLGSQVDAHLLDVIISRVLKSTGIQ